MRHYTSGALHGFILTPVPEPSANVMALLACVLVTLLYSCATWAKTLSILGVGGSGREG